MKIFLWESCLKIIPGNPNFQHSFYKKVVPNIGIQIPNLIFPEILKFLLYQMPPKYSIASYSLFRLPIIFKSSTCTAIIRNFDPEFFIKTRGQIGSFLCHSFNRYSLKRLYHMRPDYFNPYRDLCNLIEYIYRELELYASGVTLGITW